MGFEVITVTDAAANQSVILTENLSSDDVAGQFEPGRSGIAAACYHSL